MSEPHSEQEFVQRTDCLLHQLGRHVEKSRVEIITRSDLQVTVVEPDSEENFVGFVYLSDLVFSWVTKLFGYGGFDGGFPAG
jgi:hypothetical protein